MSCLPGNLAIILAKVHLSCKTAVRAAVLEHALLAAQWHTCVQQYMDQDLRQVLVRARCVRCQQPVDGRPQLGRVTAAMSQGTAQLPSLTLNTCRVARYRTLLNGVGDA